MRVGEQVLVVVNMARRDVGQMRRAQPTGFIPTATDPKKPPEGCVCDEPRYRLQNAPGNIGPDDYLDAIVRGYLRFK
jgi:hypothetical protein